MNKFITLLCILGMISAGWVLNDVLSNPVKTDQFSAENVERVRNNIPKPVVLSVEPQQPVFNRAQYADAISCLQQNIYFESRGESDVGQIATAWVTINRVHSGYYPNTVCEVVKQAVTRNGHPVRHKCQFSWYCDGKSDKPKEIEAWLFAGELAEYMIEHCMVVPNAEMCPTDVTHGALYYHTTEVAPSWSLVYNAVTQIGDHIYYTRN